MPILTFSAIAILVFLGTDQLNFLVQRSQEICIRAASPGEFGVWRAALLCGSSVNHEDHFSNLKGLGLIHLIVVSGAHLVFFERFLEKILFFANERTRWKLISLILFGYCFFAGLQPPLVRALLQRIRFTTLGFGMLFSGVTTALFFRELSLSLVLSWAAALLVAWPARKGISPFSSSLLIALGLSPLLWSLGVPPLWAALLQPLFSLYFGAFVFPISFTSLFFPLESLHSFLWSHFFALVLFCSENLDSLTPLFSLKQSVLFMGFYVLALQVLFWREEAKSLRERLWNLKSRGEA